VRRYHWEHEACGVKGHNCICAMYIKVGKLHQENSTVSY
jgi:hypothetical protein